MLNPFPVPDMEEKKQKDGLLRCRIMVWIDLSIGPLNGLLPWSHAKKFARNLIRNLAIAET